MSPPPDPAYHSIPGSDELRTKAVGADPALEAVEGADRAATVAAEVGGQWLARTLVRDDFVPVLLEVFDRLALGLGAVEQALYLHLYRLALGDERNFCRVSRAELMARTNLSDRRLGKALAALVAKDHVRLVQRDRVGTLYRVMLPHEILAESDAGKVQIARAPSTNRVQKQTPVKAPPKSEGLTLGALAAAHIARFGESPGRSRGELVEAILDRLEDGQALGEIAAELEQFEKRAPKRTPFGELARFLAGQPSSNAK